MSVIRTLVSTALFSAFMLLLAPSAHAGFFGWTTTIRATDGTTEHTRGVTAPTYPACEAQRTIAINDFIALGYTILSEPHCSPISFRIPEKIRFREKVELKWPWPGPVCLSCPFLIQENIAVIYPVELERVQRLIEKYKIDAYNQELLELQRRFDLERFEAEMLEIELGGVKR